MKRVCDLPCNLSGPQADPETGSAEKSSQTFVWARGHNTLSDNQIQICLLPFFFESADYQRVMDKTSPASSIVWSSFFTPALIFGDRK